METAVGIFRSRDDAERARQALLASGVRAEQVRMSAPLTSDGIAAEAPGQSYENQGMREDTHEKQIAQYGTEVRTGACTLSVAAARDVDSVERMMREQGAHIVTRRPRRPDEDVVHPSRRVCGLRSRRRSRKAQTKSAAEMTRRTSPSGPAANMGSTSARIATTRMAMAQVSTAIVRKKDRQATSRTALRRAIARSSLS